MFSCLFLCLEIPVWLFKEKEKAINYAYLLPSKISFIAFYVQIRSSVRKKATTVPPKAEVEDLSGCAPVLLAAVAYYRQCVLENVVPAANYTH
jgi:hypothetical protein